MESNWKCGRHKLTRIHCHSENSKGVYCLQYDDKKIVSGLRDNTIKVLYIHQITTVCRCIQRSYMNSLLASLGSTLCVCICPFGDFLLCCITTLVFYN